MPDRPIIFSAPMVRALIEGRKSQTRRVLKPQPDAGQFFGHMTYLAEQRKVIARNATGMRQDIRLPYAPGDRLWVKEGHSLDGEGVEYRVDYEALQKEFGYGAPPRWRSPIFMPRWASRLTLTVTEVRVQRVQEISTYDVIAEGVRLPWVAGGGTLAMMAQGIAKDGYRALWNSLHGPGAWDENPWVAAISFTTERRNIDA